MSRKQGVIFSYLYMFAEILSSMLFTPYLIRSLGQAEYGVYSLVATMTSYLLLLDMGIGNAIIRYMAKFRTHKDIDGQRKFLGVSVSFYTVISILVIIAGIIIRANMQSFFGKGLSTDELKLAKAMFSITMVNTAVTLFTASFKKTMIAYEKFVINKSIGIATIALRVMLSVLLLMSGMGGIGVVSANFIMNAISSLVYISYVIIKLKVVPKFSAIEKSFIKEVFSYSAFIFIQMIATQVNSMADQILIGAFVAGSSVILAIYAVGANVTHYFQNIATSINGVLMPGIVKMVEKEATPNQLLDEMVKIGRLLFIMLGLIWIVFLVNGRDFIELWAGKANSDGYLVAVIIMLPLMFTLIQGAGSQILWAMNKHKIQAYLKLASAALNIILIIFLIKIMNPLLGAAIGTSMSYFVSDVVVMNVVFKKYIKISMLEYYKRLFKGILPALVITCILGYAFTFININQAIDFISGCMFMVIVYILLLLAFGMNSNEKRMFMPFVNKIFRKKQI